MVSVQERLKLKRVQIDTWSIKEQLCLASSVLRSGDQNWMSVSRSLKPFGEPSRPGDWFSQKSCAVQYSNLLENVETPKRKKRGEKGEVHVETPGESIIRKLTHERIDELKKLLQQEKFMYLKFKDDISRIKSGQEDEKLSELGQQIEDEKKQKEREAEIHIQWLKEREEKKLELERAWKPPVTSPLKKIQKSALRRTSSHSEPSSDADSPLSEPLNVDVIGDEPAETQLESKTPTSPLLTSLLKSPSPATSQSSILHSAITSQRGSSPTIASLLNSPSAPPPKVSSGLKNLVSSAICGTADQTTPKAMHTSPSAGAPTLSMLLELPPSIPGKPLPELPTAARTCNPTNVAPSPAPAPPLRIAPAPLEVVQPNQVEVRTEGDQAKDEQSELVAMETSQENEGDSKAARNKCMSARKLFDDENEDKSDGLAVNNNIANENVSDLKEINSDDKVEDREENVDQNISKKDVKHEGMSDENKSVGVDKEDEEVKVKEVNIDEGEMSVRDEVSEKENDSFTEEEKVNNSEVCETSKKVLDESIKSQVPEEEEQDKGVEDDISREEGGKEEDDKEEETDEKNITTEAERDEKIEERKNKNEEEKDGVENASTEEDEIQQASGDEQDKRILPKLTGGKKYISELNETQFEEQEVDLVAFAMNKTNKNNAASKEASKSFTKEDVKSTQMEDEDSKSEVDDEKSKATSDEEEEDDQASELSETKLNFRVDTPTTEDDKTSDVDMKADIKRKIATPAVDSVPNSPVAAVTEEEKEYRAWKKSIMLVYGRLATHKYASLFLRPITDEQAPGYSSVIHRPIDLSVIKRNIETGVTRTTLEFQRDVMLMFQNSIMYNKSSHYVHKMAKAMQAEGLHHIQDFLMTQEFVKRSDHPVRRETRTKEANKQRAEAIDEESGGKRKRSFADSTEKGGKKRKSTFNSPEPADSST